MDFEGGALVRRWQHGPGTDEPLGLFTVSGSGGSAYELHADRLGSILRVVESATGTVAAGYDYQTFGLRTATGAFSQRYAFTGREADDESGLLYYRARHFDPATGMFLQRDPIGFAGGDLNLYAYTWNDPLNWTDPSGLAASIEIRALSGGALGIGAGQALRYLLQRCIATPGCRSASLKALTEGVGALGEALGIGAPDGSTSSPAGSEAGSGLAGIFAGILGLVDKIVQDMNDLIVRSTPNEGSGGSGGPGPGDGDGGDDDPGGDEEHDYDPYDWTDHAIDEMMDEDISPDDIYDAIENPVNVRDGNNNTTIFDGTNASVAVDTNSLSTTRPRIVTVWR